MEWNTKADSTGNAFKLGVDLFTVGTENVMLYAIWSIIGGTDTAGGYVFYDKGYSSGDPAWRYISAAPVNQSGGIRWFDWETQEYNTPIGTSTGLGAGIDNTFAIVNRWGDATDYAAKIALYYSNNGWEFWVLPSRDELSLMYTELHQQGVGGFSENLPYWSSSEEDEDGNVFAVDFSNGSITHAGAVSNFPVRAIRFF